MIVEHVNAIGYWFIPKKQNVRDAVLFIGHVISEPGLRRGQRDFSSDIKAVSWLMLQASPGHSSSTASRRGAEERAVSSLTVRVLLLLYLQNHCSRSNDAYAAAM